jgi:hypothetical protein
MILLLATALLAAVGTLYTPDQGRAFLASAVGERGVAMAQAIGIIDIFHGALFATLLCLVGVSVALCTWHRLPLINALSARFPGSPRRRWTVLTDAAMHLSLLAVLIAAAAESLFGFVGTKNIPVGVPEALVFDWRSGRDVPLGFEIVVEDLEKTYFPALAKIGVTETVAAKRLGLLTVREGAGTELGGGSLALQDLLYDPASSSLEMVALQDGRPDKVRFSTVPGEASHVVAGPYELTLVAWRRDLREVLGRVAIRERGQDVQRDLLRVNGRMRHRGWNLYLTGWGRDEFGNDFAGIQVTRDPGAALFWIGSVLFSVCLPIFFILRHRISGPRRLSQD